MGKFSRRRGWWRRCLTWRRTKPTALIPGFWSRPAGAEIFWCGSSGASLAAVELKYGFLLLVAVPFVLAILAPAEEDRLVDILPVRAGQHKLVFLPHQSRADLEARVLIGIMKNAGLGCRIEHINRGILRHAVMHRRECLMKEFVSFLITEIIIFYFP